MSAGRERGSATLLAAGVLLLLAAIVGALAWALAGQLTAHRAQGAADLAALTAARAKSTGSDDPCAAARRAAGANGVTVAECRVAGDELSFAVTVTVTARAPLGGPVRAAANAGVPG